MASQIFCKARLKFRKNRKLTNCEVLYNSPYKNFGIVTDLSHNCPEIAAIVLLVAVLLGNLIFINNKMATSCTFIRF